MKRETLRHPKTFDLASRLNVDRPTALGYLTLLWDFTAEVAIAGDIGKWPNGAIARACDWMGCADTFVEALVMSKWVDACDRYRLIVHDWPEHCERWVALKANRLGVVMIGEFSSTGTSTEPSIEASTEPSIEASPPRDQSNPIQSNPIQVIGTLDLNETDVPNGKSRRRERPTLEQVQAYCLERGNSVNPQLWFDFYSANGWKVGKNPMVDWQASVRYWERNAQQEKPAIVTGRPYRASID